MNRIMEWHIGVITQTARTLLLHAMAKWPTVITEEFWPYAICHACTFCISSICSDTGHSPHHMFTGEEAPWRMEHFRVFGSPDVFVLYKHLQDSDSLPKWKACSWLGIYFRHSLAHSGNIPMVYNPMMTNISPQFHVVFQD